MSVDPLHGGTGYKVECTGGFEWMWWIPGVGFDSSGV